jgi:hypothetical protein
MKQFNGTTGRWITLGDAVTSPFPANRPDIMKKTGLELGPGLSGILFTGTTRIMTVYYEGGYILK